MAAEPRIAPADAAELCAEPYATVRDALVVARKLAAAGWEVFEATRPYPRPGGLMVVATVHHPGGTGHDSPGDVLVAATAPDMPHDPGG